jgi:hypothetical protein
MVKRALLIILLLGMAGATGYGVYRELAPEPMCGICHRALHEATCCIITLKNGDVERTCCPRCGLHFLKGRNDIASITVADFDSGRRLDAEDAYYVEGSDVHVCCSAPQFKTDLTGTQYKLAWDRCLPSLLAFEKKESADAFMREHGGRIRTYDELLKENSSDDHKSHPTGTSPT